MAIRQPGSLLTGGKIVKLWDLVTGKPLRQFKHDDPVRSAAFSPDGRLVLTGSGTFADNTGKVRAPCGGVAFSPDGQTLITGGKDGGGRQGEARLWDAATGKPIGPPFAHRGMVWAVACGPKDPTVVTGGGDGTVRLWKPPDPVEGRPERITQWVSVLTGMDLDDRGAIRALDRLTWQKRRQRLREQDGLPIP